MKNSRIGDNGSLFPIRSTFEPRHRGENLRIDKNPATVERISTAIFRRFSGEIFILEVEILSAISSLLTSAEDFSETFPRRLPSSDRLRRASSNAAIYCNNNVFQLASANLTARGLLATLLFRHENARRRLVDIRAFESQPLFAIISQQQNKQVNANRCSTRAQRAEIFRQR